MSYLQRETPVSSSPELRAPPHSSLLWDHP
jgi:hypothetical protein